MINIRNIFTVVIGLIVLGFGGACITIPAIVDLMDTMKTSLKIEEDTANDLSSAVYNLGINLGEAIGPAFGGTISNLYDFNHACGYTSLISLIFVTIFTFMNRFSKNIPSIGSNEFSRKSQSDYYEQDYKEKLVIPKTRRHSTALLGFGYKSRAMSRSSFSKRTSDINLQSLK